MTCTNPDWLQFPNLSTWTTFLNEHAPSILLVLVNVRGFAQNRWNRHLHISPNTLACLPPKFCISIVFWFHSGPLQYPKEIKDNRYAKFWGQTRCIMGDVQMANEQLWNWLVHKRRLTVLKLLLCSWHHGSYVGKKNKSFPPTGSLQILY